MPSLRDCLAYLLIAATLIGCGPQPRQLSKVTQKSQGSEDQASDDDQALAESLKAAEVAMSDEETKEMSEEEKIDYEIYAAGELLTQSLTPFSMIKANYDPMAGEVAEGELPEDTEQVADRNVEIAEVMAEIARASIAKLLHYARKSDDPEAQAEPRVRWKAARVLLVALMKRGDSRAQTFGDEFFADPTFLDCVGFDDCHFLVTQMAAMVEAIPEKFVDPAIISRIHTLADLVSNKMLSDLIKYRYDSIEALAAFYVATGINSVENLGKSPEISPEDDAAISEKISRLLGEDDFSRNYPLSVDEFMDNVLLSSKNIAVSKDGLSKENKIAAGMFRKLLKDEERESLTFLSNVSIESAKYASYSTLGLKLYLIRLKNQDPRSWLELFKSAVTVGLYENNFIDPTVGFVTLARFSRWELMLPYRDEYLATLKTFVDAMDQSKHPLLDIEGQYQIAQSLNLSFKMSAREFVEKQKLLAFADQPDFTLEQKEQWAMKNFPNFHSLFFQELEIERAQWRAFPILHAYQTTEAPKKKEKLQEQLTEELPEVLAPLILAGCYGYFLPHTSDRSDLNIHSEADFLRYIKNKPDFQKKVISPFNAQEIDLTGACGYKIKNLAHQAASFPYKLRHKEIVSGIWQKIGFTIGELYLINFSAKWAGKVSEPIRAKLSKTGLQKILLAGARNAAHSKILSGFGRQYARWLLYKSAHYAVPHTAASIAGAFVFSVVQRAAMTVIQTAIQRDLKAGAQTLLDWDTKEGTVANLWRNYGEELAMGMAIFFFAPMVQSAMYQRAARTIGVSANQIPKKIILRELTPRQELIVASHHVAGDTLVFWSVPYVDRTVRSVLVEDHDDIWQGWSEFFKEGTHAALYGFWFKRNADLNFRKIRREILTEGKPGVPVWFYGNKAKIHDYYRTLGVNHDATQAEILKAYRDQSKVNHPDKAGGSIEATKSINAAFEVLNNAELRANYDADLIKFRSVFGDAYYAFQEWRNQAPELKPSQPAGPQKLLPVPQ